MTRKGERELRTMARQIARQVEGLDGLTPAQRCDLRVWPMEMERIADEEAEIRQAVHRRNNCSALESLS